MNAFEKSRTSGTPWSAALPRLFCLAVCIYSQLYGCALFSLCVNVYVSHVFSASFCSIGYVIGQTKRPLWRQCPNGQSRRLACCSLRVPMAWVSWGSG